MTESDFLNDYDPAAFPSVAVAVDVVMMAVVEQALRVLLIKRAEHPARGRWALPGSLLQPDEDLDRCAARAAAGKAQVDRAVLRQFRAFSAPDRDPRLRVVSIGYLGLVTPDVLLRAADGEHRMAAELRRTGESFYVRGEGGGRLTLAFDHLDIISAAVAQLRRDLDRTTDAFGLLPTEFTLRDLQRVHEVIRGESVNKPAFRKRMLDSGRLEPTGRKDTGGPFRPAELYRLRKGAQ
jgi:8-oxo-dGTP diphosphatase